jgi:hypothetical protein
VPDYEKLAKFIRLLSSPRDGEVLAAARMLSKNCDINELGNLIEHGGNGQSGGKLSKAEMQVIYDAAFKDGYQKGKSEAGGFKFEDAFPDPNDFHAIACWCQSRTDKLSRMREREFIDDVVGYTVFREPTIKQKQWLFAIYKKLGGR